MRAHVVELAVIPARAIGPLQLNDRDLVLGRVPLDLAAEAVADRLKQRRGGDRPTEMTAQEPDHLPADLQPRHIRVQIQPIDTLNLERHMTLEHVVDVRHARHRHMVNAEGGLCPPGLTALDGGRPGGGLPPSR